MKLIFDGKIIYRRSLISNFPDMKNTDTNNIINIITTNSSELKKTLCSEDIPYDGYEKSECFNINNAAIKLEFHYFKKGKDVINAVSLNTTQNNNQYFRQIAIGKIWLILKGNWSNKSDIDILMDKIVEKI